MERYVIYKRVSTVRQGRSALGLEAQAEAVRNFLSGNPGTVVGEFTEVETGKGANALNKRPVLREAISAAKKAKATLLISKLDRLARNVFFVSGLMESGVKFVCADCPTANELTLHVLSAMAQYESRRISERTREALAAAKRRGVRLGKVENLESRNKDRSQAADEFAMKMKPILDALIKQGMTQRVIVNHLNQAGIKTIEGGMWHLTSLQRLLKRIKDS